jgi:hypothetical protein
VADWIAVRVDGKSFGSELWFVRGYGQFDKMPI